MDTVNMLNLVRELLIFYFGVMITTAGCYISVVMLRRLVQF